MRDDDERLVEDQDWIADDLADQIAYIFISGIVVGVALGAGIVLLVQWLL